MASGNKNIVYNTREQAVSTDFNREQKFANQDLAEMLRYMIDVSIGRDDMDAAGVTTEYNALETPLRAEIINGFMVAPQTGTSAILIGGGVLLAIQPDGDPDASNYKYVRDPGVTSTSTLSITPNASGQTRVDVIECQVVNNVVESDNRNIYNGSTGLFTPTTVTKAVAAGLNYQVRAGTPGGGFPGTISGWLPLAIATVPTGTTTNDTVTFWDVRPIIADRAYAPFNIDTDAQRIRRMDVYGDIYSAAGKNLLRGNVEVDINMLPIVGTSTVSFGPARRAGGRLRRGTPGADVANTAPQVGITDQVDLLDANNQDATFSPPGNGFAYAYLAFPLGLPRWARYTPAGSSARVPRSPRGILILSNVVPIHGDTKPSSQISVPAVCGFGTFSFTAAAALVAIVPYVSGSPATTNIRGSKQFIGPVRTSTASAASITSSTFTITEGVDFPPNAKTIFVRCTLQINTQNGSVVDATAPIIQINDPFSNTQIGMLGTGPSTQWTNNSGVLLSGNFLDQVYELPVPGHYPAVTNPVTYTVVWSTGIAATFGSAPTPFAAATLKVVGWTF